MGLLSTVTTTASQNLHQWRPKVGFSFPRSGKIEWGGYPVGRYLSILVPAQGKLFDRRVGAVEIRIPAALCLFTRLVYGRRQDLCWTYAQASRS